MRTPGSFPDAGKADNRWISVKFGNFGPYRRANCHVGKREAGCIAHEFPADHAT
ncbi:MAG: hypothetical protein ABI155_01175 [Paralcaligenes sp.]